MDTKSLDRKQTLLQYIAHTVDLLYPEVLTFHEELKIDEACKGIHFKIALLTCIRHICTSG